MAAEAHDEKTDEMTRTREANARVMHGMTQILHTALSEREQSIMDRLDAAADVNWVKSCNAGKRPYEALERLQFTNRGAPMDPDIPQPACWADLSASALELVPGTHVRSE
jgi:hypothetical protein